MPASKLRRHAIILLLFYGLQFLAGMTLNLFVTIPRTHSGSTGNEYFSQSSHSLFWAVSGRGGTALAFHVYLALGLCIGVAVLFARSLKTHSKGWQRASGLATLLTIGALFNGLSFVDYNHNVSSMIMATCWLLAVSSIGYGLLKFDKD